jgi:hypothetical protein
MNPMVQVNADIQGSRIHHRLLNLFAVLLVGFGAAACSSGDGDEPESITPHVFGGLHAMHYPSAIGGYAADHTYLVAQADAGDEYVWPCFSTLPEDGEELFGTFTEMDVDLTTAEFMADQAPCKWPLGTICGSASVISAPIAAFTTPSCSIRVNRRVAFTF